MSKIIDLSLEEGEKLPRSKFILCKTCIGIFRCPFCNHLSDEDDVSTISDDYPLPETHDSGARGSDDIPEEVPEFLFLGIDTELELLATFSQNAEAMNTSNAQSTADASELSAAATDVNPQCLCDGQCSRLLGDSEPSESLYSADEPLDNVINNAINLVRERRQNHDTEGENYQADNESV